jgi:ABC-type antimicrobial peptide transport system, permease component
MIKNYFKIAVAVLLRRKFFTFISLFGISFTLAILMVLTAFKDSLLSANYPETRRDHCLYINRVVQQNSKHGFTMNSEPSYSYLERYVSILKTPAKIAISSLARPVNIYMNDKKLDLHIKYANAEFWDVMEFTFLEGKPFTKQEISNSENVAVISEDAKNQYFGHEASVVGKYIEANNIQYHVVGVVKNVSNTKMYSYSDIFVPYTTAMSNYRNKSYQGDYTAVLDAGTKSDVNAMENEYQQIVRRIPTEDPKNFDRLYSHADRYTESFTRAIFGNNNDTGIRYMYIAIAIFIVLFMLLPTINLVNINISRIMERSSEIGVRKAYGASSATLVLQFIFENLILTVMGGIIGVLIAVIILSVINHSDLLPNANLAMNLPVLWYSLLLCIAFGLFSGVVPAWRMSRLHVINALKSSSS